MSDGSDCGGGVATRPLCTVEELLSWQASSVPDALKSTVPLEHYGRRFDDGRLPLLVCHDMKGGYLHDRFAGGAPIGEGTDWPPPPFYIAHWNYMDVFVYFSHHFVTIPPVGWIDTAHRNGVKVLGTLITEGDGGARTWSELLCEPAKWYCAAQKLADIARTYGFDGWLINVENVIEYAHTGTLLEFLTVLRSECHRSVPCGDKQFTVVWYDAVIATSGRLRWQDELNALNAPFVDKCDAIFLNYTWTEASLKATRQCATERDIPPNKILVGIDAFGRGTMAGGGFECNIPYELICYYGFGTALFAPGWTYETLPIEDFMDNSHRFWWRLLRERSAKQHRAVTRSDIPFASTFASGLKPLAGPHRPHALHTIFDYGAMGIMPHLVCQIEDDYRLLQLDWQHGLVVKCDTESGTVRHVRIVCTELPAMALAVSLGATCTQLSACDRCRHAAAVPPPTVRYAVRIDADDAHTGERHTRTGDWVLCGGAGGSGSGTETDKRSRVQCYGSEKLRSVDVCVVRDEGNCGLCAAFLCLTALDINTVD